MANLQVNPYHTNDQLTRLEADLLWEYAKLSDNLKKLVTLTRNATECPDTQFPEHLRQLERKVGLVMTLFKGSLWAVMNDHWEGDASTGSTSLLEGDNTVTS